MTPVLDYRGTSQYDIRVDAPSGLRVFRTKTMLANSGHRATGRATRVWEVRATRVWEVYEGDGKDDQKTHALKDTWVDTSRAREGQTYKNVLAGATDEEKRFFLTVVCDGDVKLESGKDDTTLGTRRGSPPDASFQVFDKPARSDSDYLFIGNSRLPLPVEKTPAFVNRVHYRIVFNEVGVPLSDLSNMGEIWQAVCDANKGLHAIIPCELCC
jgi:hypothetical protein